MSRPSTHRGAGDEKQFLEADGTLFRKSLLLDDDTLRKVGYEGPGFDPETLDEEGDDLKGILTPSQASDAKQCKFIIPEPGKCFKTKDKNSLQKVFVNICHSEKVPEPPLYFSDTQLRNLLHDGEDDEMDNIRIPMSIGARRTDKDKGGVECQAYDIIINSTFYKEKILTSDLYWTFLCVVSLEALDEKHKVNLEKNDYVVMKHKSCHGKPEPQFVRDKPNIREVSSTPSPSTSSSIPSKKKPLIQEVDPKSTKPPTIDCEPRPRRGAQPPSNEPLVKEVSTKVYKKPEDPTAALPRLEMALYRDQASTDSATAVVKLPGLKKSDYPNVVITCNGDTLEVISIVGKSRVKAPINIVSFHPTYAHTTNTLTIKLKLASMSQEIINDWKAHGHNLPDFGI